MIIKEVLQEFICETSFFDIFCEEMMIVNS
ncbi:hypothetical protein CL2_08240 [Anaerostipes hadrus]|uniref:Uncharacterized protein n=1 Tax=Anaerostipes hadrus TaxID=649756 RepID=D4MZ05_ANAHA|nr:hypothetical protein CL2_08240 [Anaerostipes hadrus]